MLDCFLSRSGFYRAGEGKERRRNTFFMKHSWSLLILLEILGFAKDEASDIEQTNNESGDPKVKAIQSAKEEEEAAAKNNSKNL